MPSMYTSIFVTQNKGSSTESAGITENWHMLVKPGQLKPVIRFM